MRWPFWRRKVKCHLCGHPMLDHVLVATGPEPMDGGVVICPVPNCQCYATWGTNDLPALEIPNEAEVAALRAKIQNRH